MKKKLENILVLVGLIVLVLCVFALPVLATCAIIFNWGFLIPYFLCLLTVFEIAMVVTFAYFEIKED